MLAIPLLISYLAGSIPFGFIVGHAVKKTDIRKYGSGNIGATNVARVIGKKWGLVVFIGDLLKGFLAPFTMICFYSSCPAYYSILAAVCAVCGHNWPVFLKFKGGKGVATSLGAITGLCFIYMHLWLVLLLALGIWIVVFLVFRYVSLASLSAAVSFFVFSLVLSLPAEIRILAFLFLVLIVTRHKNNIRNLLQKKELRV